MIRNTKSKIDTREIRKFLTVKNPTEQQDKLPLAVLRAKVPIINGPVKLLWFTCKIEVSIVLHLT